MASECRQITSSPLRKKKRAVDEDTSQKVEPRTKATNNSRPTTTSSTTTSSEPVAVGVIENKAENQFQDRNKADPYPGHAGELQRPPKHGIFDGDDILILESGIGKARTNLFKKQIRTNGGNVTETYSDNISFTHLVVDDKMQADRLCRILDIPDSTQLFSSFKVVKCSWLTACLKEKRYFDIQSYLVDPPLLIISKEDVSSDPTKSSEAKSDVTKATATATATATEGSQLLGPSCSYHFSSRSNKHDDKSNDNVVDSDYSSSEDDGKPSQFIEPSAETFAPKRPLPKGSWACAKASSQVQVNYNKDVTDKLEALAKIYENTNDKWRALGYSKAIAALKRHPKKITTFEQAKALSGIGSKLANKVWEIIESGELRKLEEVSSSSEIQAINLFTNIWGAGAATARQWVSLGFRTLDDIRTKAVLNKQQKIGLNYYDELLDRIPRIEATEIEATVRKSALKLNAGLICQACGSYRRGKATCGDVDVLVTHPDGKSHVGIFSKLLDALHETGFITDDLVKQEDDSTQKKYLGVCKLPGENTKHRRLDIIVVPYNEYACALMYFTGSAHFNRSMRHLAGKMNMSLSEHSLNVGVVRSRGEKINKGTPLPTPTEESVFQHLGLPYRLPEERNH